MADTVVLVPGLWMPSGGFWLLARRLADRGYATRVFEYPGRSPFDVNLERFARFARGLEAPAHYVGHSLGGVLVLETLCRHADIPVRSAVLLGAPVSGCAAGRRLGRARFGRWMMGGCANLWSPHPAAWPRPEPLGVVAGTLPLGLGRLLGRLPGRNDGVVCVSETEVRGMTDRTLVPAGHSSLIFSRRVAGLVGRFLASGHFN